MQHAFHDKVVVITGASSGVGRAIARAFGEQGSRVALIASNEAALNVAAGEIRLAGGIPLVIAIDASDAEALNEAADQVYEEWGRIDVWINSAMVTVFGKFDELTPDEYRRVTDVSYHSYVYGTMAALRHMRARDAGRIIQIGSAMAYRSIPLQSAYCGAKAGIRAFTESLRTELLHEQSSIEICQLQLPAVNTPQPLRQRNKTGRLSMPVPPIFTPESMAETVVWAAERMPREVLVGWPSVRAVWAGKLFPGIADWYLARYGFDDQLTDTRLEPGKKDILFETVPGDPGARGPFESRQRGRDWQMVIRMNPRPFAAAAFMAVVGLVALLRR